MHKIANESGVSICRRVLLRNDEIPFDRNESATPAAPDRCPECGLDIFQYQTVSGQAYRRCFHCGHHDFPVDSFRFASVTVSQTVTR